MGTTSVRGRTVGTYGGYVHWIRIGCGYGAGTVRVRYVGTVYPHPGTCACCPAASRPRRPSIGWRGEPGDHLLPRDAEFPSKADRSDLQEHVSIDAVLFTHLFPDGQGGYDPDANQKFVEYARKRLLGQDGRFEADVAYIMWLQAEQMKKRLSGNVNVRMKGQLAPNLGDQFADFNHQIFTALRDSPGTQPYLFTKRGVALGMYEQLGKPQFLLTLTCQRQNESMLRVKTDHILKGCRGSCVMPT